MPDAETLIRAAVDGRGWTLREMPAIPGESGWIEVRPCAPFDTVTLRAEVPLSGRPGYCPWNALYQSACALTDPELS